MKQLCNAALLLAGLAAPVMPLHADQLIDNANGISLDQNGKPIYFSGLLIGDDGRVKQLLNRSDRRPKKVDFLFDAKGHTLAPGFAAPRCDIPALGLARVTLDLSGATSLADAQKQIALYAASHPAQRWIIGHGWNSRNWGLNRTPNAADLDTVVVDRPVWLVDSEAQAGWANNAALKQARLNIDGLIDGAAMESMQAIVPTARPAEVDQAIGDAQQALLSRGITMAHQAGADIADWQAFRRAGDENRLQIRIAAYAHSVADMVLIAGQQPTPWLYQGRLRLVGLWQKIDGGLATRSAWLNKPYTDGPANNRGTALLGNAELRNIMSRAAMDQFQVALAAHGDGAVAEAVNAVEELSLTYKHAPRWRIAAIDLASETDIARMAPLGIIAEFDPMLSVSAPALADQRLGPDRAGQSWPGRSLADAGAGPVLDSACGPALPNPLHSFAAAISRADGQGNPFGGWQGAQRLSREQALAGLTLLPARAAMADKDTGTLQPGSWADFVLLDTDLMLAPPSDIWNAKVLESWVGGRRLYAISQAP